MILILIILIVIIAIGITVVMLTTGKTDITTITLTDIKKGLSSGISSVTTGKGLCPVGKVLINNECKTPKENITKETCNSQGKVLYNNKCLVEINQQYCDTKGSFLKPDPETNFTSCTEMDSNDLSKNCKDNQVFFDGSCKDILKEDQCSKKLFLALDEKTKNTSCKEISNIEKNQVCLDNNKLFYDNQCKDILDDNYCKYDSNWIHSKGETNFHAYADENTNYTSCRGPNENEKIAQCLAKDFQYDPTEDKCICPNNGEIKHGKCYSLKTKEICFPKSIGKTNVATFKKPNPDDKLTCVDMNQQEKKDFCKYVESDNTTLTMNYTGNINKTKSGKTCIPWKDMTLYKNEFSLDRIHPGTIDKLQKEGHNYCRDLDENGALWCYTKNKREGNDYWEECKRENLDNNLCKDWIEDGNKKFLPKTDKSEKCLKAMFDEAKSNCLNIETKYDEFMTDEIRNNNHKDINKKMASWVANGCSQNEGENKHDHTLPKTYVNNFYNNKCMKVYSDKECKEDKSYPNYSDNEFYQKIFYKKPDETKNYTSCRKLYQNEEKEICEKPENNSVYVDGTCFQKLDKPKIEILDSSFDSIKIKVKFQNISELTDYFIKYKINKKSEEFSTSWLIYDFNLEEINLSDKSVIIEINKLENNTEYKLILKIINKKYNQIQTSDSDEISVKTKCNSKIFTDEFCRTKDGVFLGPTQTNKYGLVNENKKDSTVSSWPYIKVPNKSEDGTVCGCKEMNNSEEIKNWCKKNIYPNFKFDEGRDVKIENNQCKISEIPVGPVENISATGLEINQTIKNDEYLDSEFYRTDYPYRIKIYWEFPLESIKLSGNSDDVIPHTYKIERKEKSKTEWTHIHDYIVNDEIDYLNTTTKSGSSVIEAFSEDQSCTKYIVNQDDKNPNLSNSKKGCSNYAKDSNLTINLNYNNNLNPKGCFSQIADAGGNYVYFNNNNSSTIKCKNDNKSFCIEKSVNTECLKNQHTKFIWIDGDYGLETLFKPNMLSNFNNDDQKLKPGTEYQYKITPINNSGPGKSIVIEARTINQKLNFNDCKTIDDGSFKQVLNENYTSCRTMNQQERNQQCYIQNKIYNKDSKKCVNLQNYIAPGKPTIKSEILSKNSISFTIVPPEIKGTPELSGYLIKWKKKTDSSWKRLIFYSNFSLNKHNEVQAITETPKKYIKFPSNEWTDSDNSITNFDDIKIIHNKDELGNYLLPDTEYQYKIRTISKSSLWQSSPSNVQTITESSEKFGASDETDVITFKTLESSPIDTPVITFMESNQKSNKTVININIFPATKKGGNKLSIKKYKIVRTNYDMTTLSSDLTNVKEFVIDFSSTTVKTEFHEIINNQKSQEDNTDNKYFEVKPESTSAAINSSNKLIFEDKTVIPFTRYNYKIYCMNSQVNKWSDEIYTRSLDITTPSINNITTIDFKNNIQITDIQKLPSGFNKDNLDEFPNLVLFKASLNDVIDPNVELYNKYPDFYKTIYQKHQFVLNYNSNRGSSVSIVKNINLNNNNAEKIFYIPYNRLFEVEFRSQFQGELNIPGKKNQIIISNGIKKLPLQIINSTDPKINLNESACNNYKEYFDTKGYEINYFYNKFSKKCQSRKPSYNNSKFNKLNDFCETKLQTSKWYGNDEEEPCKIPIDGKWEEEILQDTTKNICRQSANKVNGEERICLNEGSAFSVEKRWKYTPPQYGGKHTEKPSEADYVKNDTTTNTPLNAYKFKKCSLEKCSNACSNLFGSLTSEGKNLDGMSENQLNNALYCNKGSFQPSEKNKFSNCDGYTCGNPEGKSRNEKWGKTYTCIDGYNSKNKKLIDCKYTLSENDQPIEITPTPDKKPTDKDSSKGYFDYGKWYQCKSVGTSKYNMDPKFNNILDSNGKRFCNPPFKEVQTLKSTSSGKINQIIYLPKYFKIEKVKCNDELNTKFPLCPIVKTKPDNYNNNSVACGTEIINQDIKCENNGIESVDLWSCTDTTIDASGNKLTPSDYYYKYLNKGDTKKTWINKMKSCKEKCEGPNNEISTDGYDKWEGSISADKPYYYFRDPLYKNSCKKKDKILPLYQEGVIETPCIQCNPNSKPMKLYDLCIDGKYGPEDEIKCSKATTFRSGNANTFEIDGNKIKNPENYNKHKFLGSDLVNLKESSDSKDTFNSKRYQSDSYTKPCNITTCNYDYSKMGKSFITDDTESRCRGDFKYTSIKCKDSNGQSVDLSKDIENKCSGLEVDQIIKGNKKCTKVIDEIIKFDKNYDIGEITNQSDKNKIKKCNDPLDPKTYYTHYKCLDDKGNKVASTYLGNKEDNTLGKSKIEQNKIINCFTNKGKESIPVAKEDGPQKTCKCTCNYTHSNGETYPLGEQYAVTGTQCTEKGASICKSCPDNMEKSGTECVCKQHYIWSTSQKKCIREPFNCNESSCRSWSNVGAPERKEGPNQSQSRICPVTDPLTNSTQNDGQGLYGGTPCSVFRKIAVPLNQRNCVYKNSWKNNSTCNQELNTKATGNDGPFNGGIACPSERTKKTTNRVDDAKDAHKGTNDNRDCDFSISCSKKDTKTLYNWGNKKYCASDTRTVTTTRKKCGNGKCNFKLSYAGKKSHDGTYNQKSSYQIDWPTHSCGLNCEYSNCGKNCCCSDSILKKNY